MLLNHVSEVAAATMQQRQIQILTVHINTSIRGLLRRLDYVVIELLTEGGCRLWQRQYAKERSHSCQCLAARLHCLKLCWNPWGQAGAECKGGDRKQEEEGNDSHDTSCFCFFFVRRYDGKRIHQSNGCDSFCQSIVIVSFSWAIRNFLVRLSTRYTAGLLQLSKFDPITNQTTFHPQCKESERHGLSERQSCFARMAHLDVSTNDARGGWIGEIRSK